MQETVRMLQRGVRMQLGPIQIVLAEHQMLLEWVQMLQRPSKNVLYSTQTHLTYIKTLVRLD